MSGDWPGTDCESIGNGIYRYCFGVTIDTPDNWQIIFNNGNSGVGTNQTADLDCENGKLYQFDGSMSDYQGGGSTTTPDTPTVTPPTVNPDEQSVFFEKPSHWSSAFCYIWYKDADGNTIEECGSWPGKACQGIGDGVFKMSFNNVIGSPSEWGLVFNNGTSGQGNQTDNLVAKNNYLYKMDGASAPVVPPTDIDEVEDEDIIIYVYERNIFVAHDGSLEVAVYGIDGRIVYKGYAMAIPVEKGGVYIVTVNGKAVKVLVR
jgi:hypothetical protein